MKEIHPFDIAENKRRNDLLLEEVSLSYLFETSPDADVSILLGPPINGQSHLVLCCFHKPKTLLKDQVVIDQLFCDVMAVAVKKGFECQMKGGSTW